MKDINFDCPNCTQSLECPPEMAGVAIDCPTCQKRISVPLCGQHILATMTDVGTSADCPNPNGDNSLVVAAPPDQKSLVFPNPSSVIDPPEPETTCVSQLPASNASKNRRRPLLISLVAAASLIIVAIAAFVFHGSTANDKWKNLATSSDKIYDATTVAKKLVGIWNSSCGQVLSFDDKSRISLDAIAIAPGRATGDSSGQGSPLAGPYEVRGKVKFRIVRDEDIERQADRKGPIIQFSTSGEVYQPRWLVVSTGDGELSLFDGTQGKLIVFKRLSKEAYKITDETDPGGNAMIWLKVGEGTQFKKDKIMWSGT
jgi:hypothetical protein